jgi:hypothetical protein
MMGVSDADFFLAKQPKAKTGGYGNFFHPGRSIWSTLNRSLREASIRESAQNNEHPSDVVRINSSIKNPCYEPSLV